MYKKLQLLLSKSNLLCRTTSSCPQVFCKKRVLKSFSKFTGQDPCWSLFFKKVAGLTPVTLLKTRIQYVCYPVNFAKFFKHLFLQNFCGGCFYRKKVSITPCHQSYCENSFFGDIILPEPQFIIIPLLRILRWSSPSVFKNRKKLKSLISPKNKKA